MQVQPLGAEDHLREEIATRSRREASQAIAHGVSKSRTLLSTQHCLL